MNAFLVCFSDEFYPLECKFEPWTQNDNYQIGDKVQFRKQYGIKGLKVYAQTYRQGKIRKVSGIGNVIRFVVEDEEGKTHSIGSRQIRPCITYLDKC